MKDNPYNVLLTRQHLAATFRANEMCFRTSVSNIPHAFFVTLTMDSGLWLISAIQSKLSQGILRQVLLTTLSARMKPSSTETT